MNAHEGSQFPLILKAPSLGPSLSMSSADIAEVTEKRHGDVIRDIKKMLSELYSEPGGKFEGPLIDDAVLRHLGKSVTWEKDARGYVTMIHLDKEHTLTLVSGYDVRLRKRMVDKLAEIEALSAQPAAIPTTAEAFAHAFRMLADSERVHAAQSKAIARIEEKVERVETAQTVLKARPSNAEAITHVRARIGRLHGLSAQVIDAVMRQTTYAPKPAGMVKNDHESADGATYAVYWQKDVTETFKRFVSECVQVTPTMFTHPFIEGRFRCPRKAGPF